MSEIIYYKIKFPVFIQEEQSNKRNYIPTKMTEFIQH